jgi:ATP-binding cassette subfamily B protein/subfamily B ATP-binding cassette protein MsbA
MMHEFHIEEKELGRVFDRKIIARLLFLLKPYLKYLIISLVLLIIAALVELVFPNIMRFTIDRYITKTGYKLQVGYDKNLPKLSENVYFITQSQLSKVSPDVVHKWQKENLLSKQRYFYLYKTEIDKDARILIEKNSAVFEQYDNIVIAPYDKLTKINAQELLKIRRNDLTGVFRMAILFLGIIFIGVIVNFIHLYLMQYAGQLFMHSLRMKIFQKLQDLDLAFFDHNPVGRLVTRATNDVEAINEALSSVFTTLVRDILLLIGIVVIMLWINLRLALITFIVVPLVVVLTSYFRIKARDIYRLVRRKLARLNATLQENISGMRVIKVFANEKESQQKFDAINRDYLSANLKEVTLMSFFRPLIEVISSLGIGLVLYYGGGRVITGNLSLGILVAFLTYVEMFFRPIRELTESYTILQSAMASSERIFQLLDEEIRITSKSEAIELTDVKGEIEFQNVWFSYDEKEWVLKDVCFKIRPGERVAFVGPTGAGKTSIISLLSRFYEIQKGKILIDGIDIKDIGLETLRSKIGVVMQDVFLFSGDIKSNIRLNLPIEDDRVKEIAAYINADKFIDRFPNKYDEVVMERGVTLSTGERQLLSFARVLAFNPRILILDEATASIDAETEQYIQDGLRKLITGRTAIIIAHRLSTIKGVDRIYVLHKGEIKEVGTHQELLARKGIYYHLYQLQSMQ